MRGRHIDTSRSGPVRPRSLSAVVGANVVVVVAVPIVAELTTSLFVRPRAQSCRPSSPRWLGRSASRALASLAGAVRAAEAGRPRRGSEPATGSKAKAKTREHLTDLGISTHVCWHTLRPGNPGAAIKKGGKQWYSYKRAWVRRGGGGMDWKGGGILGGGAVYGPGSENPWHRQQGPAPPPPQHTAQHACTSTDHPQDRQVDGRHGSPGQPMSASQGLAKAKLRAQVHEKGSTFAIGLPRLCGTLFYFPLHSFSPSQL